MLYQSTASKDLVFGVPKIGLLLNETFIRQVLKYRQDGEGAAESAPKAKSGHPSWSLFHESCDFKLQFRKLTLHFFSCKKRDVLAWIP